MEISGRLTRDEEETRGNILRIKRETWRGGNGYLCDSKERKGKGYLGDRKNATEKRADGSMRDEEARQGDILRLKKERERDREREREMGFLGLEKNSAGDN